MAETKGRAKRSKAARARRAAWRWRSRRLKAQLRRLRHNEQIVPALMALAVGVAAGYGALAFRWAIGFVQRIFYGFADEHVYERAGALDWWQLLLAPAVGGLLIGLFLRYVMPGGRPLGVAEVIEASALKGGRMRLRDGLGAALASAASVGVGASVGREGPVVHLGASMASWIAGRLRLGRTQQQTLLGCGVAAAIAASFNAPLAGVIFALEVVVGHYALTAFAPVVVAAVLGTIITRAHFGAIAAFAVPLHRINSFWEFPAFALLGMAAAGAAIVLMRGIAVSTDLAERAPLPIWARPALGGLAIGAIAIAFPHVLGVGYGTVTDALNELFPLWLLLALVGAKILATSVSLGFGFGGGVFSPSLVIGAMLGGAFGIVATQLFPELSSGQGAYTLIGMGAVTGAVLGAPISTVLIIFELTGDYALTTAVMVAVVVASVLTQQFHGRSFFHWQLARRGLDVQGGREVGLLRAVRVGEVMDPAFESIPTEAGLEEVRRRLIAAPDGTLFVTNADGRLLGIVTFAEIGEAAFDTADDEALCAGAIARGGPPVLLAGETLESAVERIGGFGEAHIAVVDGRDSMVVVGVVHERDIMLAYQRALLQARAEERGES